MLSGGTGSSDEIEVTVTGDTIAAAQMASITGFETITTVADAGTLNLTLNDANVAASGQLTIDATSMATNALTLDASNETDGNVVVTAAGTAAHNITLGLGNDTYTSTSTAADVVVATGGNNTISTGDGADDITLANGNDDVTAGSGNDEITVSSNNLTANKTIRGGDGTDILYLSDNAVVIDSDFAGITSVETLSADAEIQLVATLGSQAADAGIVTVTLVDEDDANDSLTVGAGFDAAALTVNLDDDATNINTVNASAYTGNLTINADDDELDTVVNVLTGGSGTDTLVITSTTNETIAAAQTAQWSGIENITTAATAGTLSLQLSDGNVAAGETLTIDATSMTTAAFTLLGANEADGNLVVSTRVPRLTKSLWVAETTLTHQLTRLVVMRLRQQLVQTLFLAEVWIPLHRVRVLTPLHLEPALITYLHSALRRWGLLPWMWSRIGQQQPCRSQSIFQSLVQQLFS